MKIYISILISFVIFLVSGSSGYASDRKDELEILKQQIRDLRADMENRQQAYEKQIELLQKKIDNLATELSESGLEEEIRKAQRTGSAKKEGSAASAGRVFQGFNPDISVIIDSNYYNEDAREAVSELRSEVPGFGHAHGEGHEHAHSHGGLEKGFNIREVEIHLSAEVDPYFKAYTTLAFHEGGAEIEEAVIQTSSLPAGFQLLGGKFLSHFGRINRQHPHEWDFIDRPLVFEMSLGDHGLLEKGLQLSWLAPAPFHLLLGMEALQGENENMFSSLEDEVLPHNDGPRLWVGWAKLSPNLPDQHAMQMGLSFGYGNHQEAHDGDGDGEYDHWLDGNTTFFGIDSVYKFNSGYQRGKGDLTIQAEYFYRKKDLKMIRHDLAPLFEGRPRVDKQDGFYAQAVYGLMPRWRMGLRWDQAGLINKTLRPSGAANNYDSSYRIGGMLDFTPSEFSRIRFQANRGKFAFEDSDEKYWQFMLQFMVSLGTHGAHKF